MIDLIILEYIKPSTGPMNLLYRILTLQTYYNSMSRILKPIIMRKLVEIHRRAEEETGMGWEESVER
jgi:hypothetical protein